MLSVLILTHNEALDLPGALASVAWSDDIHVLDSHSTDQSVPLAQAGGATVHQRLFDTYAAQRNFGLSLPFKHPWLFILDADERLTPALTAELQRIVLAAPASVTAYTVRRRDFLFGTHLSHAQLSPIYIRLLRPERCRYSRAVNEVLEVDGAIGTLQHPLDHFPFSKGIVHWIDRHNRYSTLEAELVHSRRILETPSIRTALRDPDFHTRRLHQKAFFYRLGSSRPILKWFYMVLIRGALLDGAAGVTYATLQAVYEYLIVLKTRELRLNSSLNSAPTKK